MARLTAKEREEKKVMAEKSNKAKAAALNTASKKVKSENGKLETLEKKTIPAYVALGEALENGIKELEKWSVPAPIGKIVKQAGIHRSTADRALRFYRNSELIKDCKKIAYAEKAIADKNKSSNSEDSKGNSRSEAGKKGGKRNRLSDAERKIKVLNELKMFTDKKVLDEIIAEINKLKSSK